MKWYTVTLNERVAEWLVERVMPEEIELCEENDQGTFAEFLRGLKGEIASASPIWDDTCPKCGADHEYQSLNETELFECECGHEFEVTEVTDYHLTWQTSQDEEE